MLMRKGGGSGGLPCPDISVGKDLEMAGVRFQEVMKGGAAPGDAVPIVFAFHSRGSGVRQYNKSTQLSAIGPSRVIIPYGPYTSRQLTGGSPDNYHFFPSGIKSLVNKNTEQELRDIFLDTADWFKPFAERIVSCRPTNMRPVFTGSSMGAEMAYLMNATMPGFAGLTVAVNGYLPRPLWNANISPQAALHGRSDDTVPYSWDKEYNDTIIQQGAPATFVSYDAGHTISSAMSRDWQAYIKNYTTSASA